VVGRHRTAGARPEEGRRKVMREGGERGDSCGPISNRIASSTFGSKRKPLLRKRLRRGGRLGGGRVLGSGMSVKEQENATSGVE